MRKKTLLMLSLSHQACDECSGVGDVFSGGIGYWPLLLAASGLQINRLPTDPGPLPSQTRGVFHCGGLSQDPYTAKSDRLSPPETFSVTLGLSSGETVNSD